MFIGYLIDTRTGRDYTIAIDTSESSKAASTFPGFQQEFVGVPTRELKLTPSPRAQRKNIMEDELILLN